MRRGQGPGEGLGNWNTVGVGIVAPNDGGINQAQIDAAYALYRQHYSGLPFFGHGEVNPHKDPNEAMSAVNFIRSRSSRTRGALQDFDAGWTNDPVLGGSRAGGNEAGEEATTHDFASSRKVIGGAVIRTESPMR